MAADVVMSSVDDLFELPPRKKPKVSELPLSSAQRASIDSILHTFKKKGEFDALRKKGFQQYSESAQRGLFEAALRDFTALEIERDPLKYLKPDRRMGAPLLEGAAARRDVYTKTEADVDAYIALYLANAERALRDIRRKEIGDEAADAEYQRGQKSDEAYAAEAEARAKDRAKVFADQEKLRKKQEAQQRKKKVFEELKKKEDALMKETETLQREQRRRAEREAFKAAEKEKERERIRKYNEERDKVKKEAEEREKAVQEERERRQRERVEREQKRLEEEALDLLLREGKEMSAKAKRPELERSDSMEPPPRLAKHSAAPRNNLSKEEMRSQGLMPTSLTLRRGDKPTDSAPTPSSTKEEDRPRGSRIRSPSPTRSSFSRRREPSPHNNDDDRRPSRRDAPKRETLYRDISAERAAWKAKLRDRSRGVVGEEGELVEPRRLVRSRSRDSMYRRRRGSRSPPAGRRRLREDSRSRSPARYRDREREREPLRRRDRSRSPPGIDRYIPGGGSGGAGGARRESGARRVSPSRRASPARRASLSRRASPARRTSPARRPSPARRLSPAASRRVRGDDDEADSRRKSSRNDDRAKPIDRYVPSGAGGGRASEGEKPAKRHDRSRSRSRSRARNRDRDRDRDREGDKEERNKGRAREREAECGEKARKREGEEEEKEKKADVVSKITSRGEVCD